MVRRTRRWQRFGALAAAVLLLVGVNLPPLVEPSAAAPAAAAPSVGGCPLQPADNIWNARVDTLPLHARSSEYLNSIGLSHSLKADFGSGTWNGGPIGIPYDLVTSSTPRVNVTFDYADQSDPGPYPMLTTPSIEGGPSSTGDRHILMVDQSSCKLYELYAAYPNSDGSWQAGSGAIFDLSSNQLRPAGWTSADAAGLPILPGLARYGEAASGQINHALRFTANVTQHAYVWPARHQASSNTSLSVPPMGTRLRLKAGKDISGYSAINRVLLQAMKTYGLILADNGSDMYVSGAPDPGWNDDDLQLLKGLTAADFEVVDASSLQVSADSGQAASGGSLPTSTPTPTGAAQTATPTGTASPTPTATRTAAPATATATATRTAVPPTATPTRTPAPPTATPTASAGDHTLVVQGSSLMTDTWISPDYPTTSNGALDLAHLQGSYTPDRLLFQPKLTGLPSGAAIQSATLAVYAYNWNGLGPSTLSAYRILRSWSAGTATYNWPWRQPGLRPGTDYNSTAVGNSSVNGVGWLQVDVTAAVKSWTSGASTNRGLVVMLTAGPGSAHYRVDLTEASDPSVWPRLTVVYR
jgi:hypothetical protein